MTRKLLAAVLSLCCLAAGADPLPFEKFIRVETGMDEGQVLQITGKPDMVTVDSERPFIVKSYYFFGNNVVPFNTRIIFSGGVVFSIEREKIF
jgi:hypothetical protein